MPVSRQYLVRLPDGTYYWEPPEGTDHPDRWCHSQLAAKKFSSRFKAQEQAKKVKGTVVPYQKLYVSRGSKK